MPMPGPQFHGSGFNFLGLGLSMSIFENSQVNPTHRLPRVENCVLILLQSALSGVVSSKAVSSRAQQP